MNEFNRFKFFSIGFCCLWLVVFALIPTLMMVVISFMSHTTDLLYTLPLTLKNYTQILDPLYFQVFIRSMLLAFLATILCLIISYPFAYLVAHSKPRYKSLLILMVILPFWTSSLIRTYAIMAILKAKGIINSLLLWLGIIHQPLQLLYTNSALVIGLVYTLLPFMILPLYANMDKLDPRLFEAAKDLGASRTRIFLQVLLPLTMPGILSGVMLVFLPAMTLFYLPALLGGSRSLLLGNLIQNQFLGSINWPVGAATSSTLVLILLVMLAYYWRHTRTSDRAALI